MAHPLSLTFHVHPARPAGQEANDGTWEWSAPDRPLRSTTVPRVLFVRHSLAVITPAEAPADWPLSPTGRARARRLGEQVAAFLGPRRVPIVASSEVKAIETAELLGCGPVAVDPRIGEVAKRWYDSSDDHRDAAIEYLAGRESAGWEPRQDALARFDAAIAHVANGLAVVVTHGTVLTLWLSDRIDGFEPGEFWPGLEMPDAYLLDLTTNRLERLGAGPTRR